MATTLADELAAALPRGIRIEAAVAEVRIDWRHVNGAAFGIVVEDDGRFVDETIAAVARELRRAVERWGPIAAAEVAQA